MISADSLWEHGFGVVFPELWGEPSFEQIAGTLDLIESLRPSTVIPGHGSTFFDATVALERARSRLDAFARAPIRHARYALKVLIKFKLMDSKRMRRSDLDVWLAESGLVERVRLRFFPDLPMRYLATDLLIDLANSGAAILDSNYVSDAG